MSQKGKSSGWASFVLKQRQKQGVEPEVDSEPYPPMHNSLSSMVPCHTSGRNNDLSNKSFASLLLPSAKSTTMIGKGDFKKPTHVGSSIKEDVDRLAFEKLKGLHIWADNSLIEDIMVVVNNDIDTASTLLKEMGFTGSFDDNRETNNVELGSTSEDHLVTIVENKDESLVKVINLVEGSSSSEDYFKDKNDEIRVDSSFKDNYFEGLAEMEWLMNHLNDLPMEPEYSEDDVYVIHRKDALKAMRSASRHSKAATTAFLRGDHFSAQQHSVKAQEQWIAAQKLHAEAAKEILSIRNKGNDIWKFDLHGLHAAEAIQALKERLWKIETQNPSLLSNGEKTVGGIVRSHSLESLSGIGMDKLYQPQLSSRQKNVSLQVITGRGNHSKGEAALPIAVRTFLNENRYRFNETRPGVITVTPKSQYS